MAPLTVLYEDNHLIAVFKAPGRLTQGDLSGETSLLDETREWIRVKYQKPGRAFLGLLHRLDRPASGVVVFAKTSKAASRMSAAIRSRNVTKIYRTQVEGDLTSPQGKFSDRIVLDSDGRILGAPEDDPNGKLAELEYRLLKSSGKLHWLEIKLLTGRKHQIRFQFAQRGLPIVGDHLYGSKAQYPDGIALLSYEYSFSHPTTEAPLAIRVPEHLSPLAGQWPHH